MPTSRDILHQSVSAATLRRRTIIRDPSSGRHMLIEQQNLAPVLREAELARETHRPGVWKRNPAAMVRVAAIPIVIRDKLIARGIWQDRDMFLKWLSSDEAAPYRCDDGRRLA